MQVADRGHGELRRGPDAGGAFGCSRVNSEILRLGGLCAAMPDRSSGRMRQSPLWRCGLVFLGLLAGPGLHDQSADSGERTGPVKIGALTQSWGPTPQMVGLRDGLRALGYRGGGQFVIGG